ncbi:hypothetical protein [Mesorhizobium loti]|uniref:hypothetical protein n=1 Tax=Rhizobium loti TaxID=381 RepID=UPI000414524A|nr:hypothetical protein [Mesorhizobium loti]
MTGIWFKRIGPEASPARTIYPSPGTGGEYASRAVAWLDIVINLGLLFGLYNARKALMGAAPADYRWKVGTPLDWAAMVSGIGMLLIRVSSSHGWWTGHLM